MNRKGLRLWWKQVTCKHERIASFCPSNVFWYNKVSRANGAHTGVMIEGCLNCHKIWIRDYRE